MKMNKKRAIIIFLIIIILLAFFIRLFPLRIFHWWDETVYLQNAETIFSGRTNYDEFSFRPPLLSIIFAGVFFLWHSAITASIVVALICTLAMIFVFLIGKKMYNVETGVIAALITGFAPFIVLSSNFLLTDVPSMALLAISFYFGLFKEKNKLFLSGIFASLAILMKFTAILFIPVMLLHLIIKRRKTKEVLIWLVGAIIIAAPYLIWVQVAYGNFLHTFVLGSRMVSDDNRMPQNFYIQKIPFAFTYLVPLGLILFAIASLKKIENKEYELLKKESILLVWCIIFLAYLSFNPHKELRYILPIAPPIILLASTGFVQFHKNINKLGKYVIYILVIFALVYTANSQMPFIKSTINTSHLKLIDSSKSPEIIVSEYIVNDLKFRGTIVTAETWPVFAYYTNLKTVTFLPYDNSFYSDYKTLMDKNTLVIIKRDSVKNPQISWFNKNKDFKLVKNFDDIYIYQYTQ